MMKHKLLFLAANPCGLTARKLDEEARAIREEIQLACKRDRFEFVPHLAAQPMDLLRALRAVEPSIVHFVGHPQTDGIYLTSDSGQPMQITTEALHATFGAAGRSVQIVVLNGCATEELAAALCDLVPVCVGTQASISDEAARAFSVGFYGALASSESAAQACLQGKAAMYLAVAGHHAPPILHHRRDVDPEALVLAEAGAGTADADDADASRATDLAAVLERYRAHKRGSFERWDLRTAGPTPTAGNRPAEITLDQMYIPLRFAPELDPTQPDRGAPIELEELIGPRKPLVVIGGAGSGKTTWMRWTFRRLIEDARAVPFFLELRAIAAAWKTPGDAALPVESYLADALSGCGADDPEAVVADLLADTSGPRPVLLLDGWDELGAHGERLRERLVELCRAFPHVNVVVSSRPYGDTRPAGAEAFETLFIQPLSDRDIRLLATHFHRRVHCSDEPTAVHATDELMATLVAAPEARALAGTSLLLTMMLLISRGGPLPGRRHQLYTACLRNLVIHRATQRERDGVILDPDQQWRPDDGEARLRAVAELAYRLQAEGYGRTRRTPVSCTWDNAVELLRNDWTPEQRDRFLRWLVASTGVLIDRTDGAVQFAHLSFQEHLAAYHLFSTRDGDACFAAVQSHMENTSWWETLRLLAALIGDHGPDKLGPVLDLLRAGTQSYWLAGQIFADGTGRADDFDAWVAELPAHLSDPFTYGEDCATAWAASKQAHRRAEIAATLSSARGKLHWLDGTWHAHWCDLARLEVERAPALLALGAPLDSAIAVGRSRVLHGASASWPDGGELAALRLWPSPRGSVGVRLQTVASLRVQTAEVTAMASTLLAMIARPWSTADHQRVTDLVQNLARDFAKDLGPDLGGCFARDFGRVFWREHGGHYGPNYGWDFGQDFARVLRLNLPLVFSRNFGAHSVLHLARHFERYFRRYFGPDFGRQSMFLVYQRFGREFGIPDALREAPWQPTYGVLLSASVAGCAAPRAAMAHGQAPDEAPLLALFRAACRASFAPHDAALRAAAARASADFSGDPLWPALARHIARISTAEDRALLVELARHPEQREPPLSWGLQYYVRGDLVLGDDSVVTLDELSARAGLPVLPLLEDMPDELDL
jgi:NACHT domain